MILQSASLLKRQQIYPCNSFKYHLNMKKSWSFAVLSVFMYIVYKYISACGQLILKSRVSQCSYALMSFFVT